MSNFASNTVTKLRASDGAALGTTTNVSAPLGLAFDGTNIWAANNLGSGAVTKVRASDGVILGTFRTFAGFPGQVAFDGDNVWVTHSTTLTKLRASDGGVLATLVLAFNIGGIAFDGTNMWVANETTSSRYGPATEQTCKLSLPGSLGEATSLAAHGDTVILSCEDVTVVGVASVTFTVKLNNPVAVGLPEMTPVLALSVKPPGSGPLPGASAHV